MQVNRRRFCQGLAGSALALPYIPHATASGYKVFVHGVASGDPLSDRVILWTRVTSDSIWPLVTVRWRIANDPQMNELVDSGLTVTSALSDFTVKIDAKGLQPDSTYYYQFEALDEVSPIGRTKTLPEGHADHVRFAMTSCSNWEFGQFNVYGMIARRHDLDVVLHLGDYIYEYEPGEYGDPKSGRLHVPAKEITTLEDYRMRYAQYRTDAQLQEVHRQLPFICIWDDHETTDNSWRDGASNHDDSEGDWQQRKEWAIQAYYEWLPIRQVERFNQERIYRKFSFGNLMDLMMLDTRLIGRDEQANPVDIFTINDHSRTLLGFEQEAWLYNRMAESQAQGTTWKVLGQQVMMAQLNLSAIGTNRIALNPDQWDGYPKNRQRLLKVIDQHQIDNTVILTGDIHCSWANEITPNPYFRNRYNPVTGEGSRAVELVTSAVTSPAIPIESAARIASKALELTHPHMKFIDLFHRGYITVDLTHDRMQADWYFTKEILKPSTDEFFAKGFRVEAGTNLLQPVETPAPAKPNAADPAP